MKKMKIPLKYRFVYAPTWEAMASKFIATPLLVVTVVMYIQNAVNKQAAVTYPIGIAAFGITAALSGICFTKASTVIERDDVVVVKYAGDMFLHSSLLLLQTIFIVYARDSAVSILQVQGHLELVKVCNLGAAFVFISVSSASAWAWQKGFASLNTYLWVSWIRDIKQFKVMADKYKRSIAELQQVPDDEQAG